MKKTGSFEEYTTLFIQRLPRYAIKSQRSWISKNKPLSDVPIKAHLAGKYAVAVLGKWYPEFAILDIDSKPVDTVQEIRESLNLTSSNSKLHKSESADSYHLLFRPEYYDKPPTLNLLNAVFRNFCRTRGVEIYPQRSRAIRLPFGPNQLAVDLEYAHLKSWEDHLYWFEKLDKFDLSSVKDHQMVFDFERPDKKLVISIGIMEEAEYFYDNGLQAHSTRHETQHKIIYFFWRQNVSHETAKELVWDWINKKHNGFSKDILRSPREVKREIERQADHIYSKYQYSQIYPDSTHNLFTGYITKPDLSDIVEAARASLPRMRFLFNLVKYSYPRRLRTFVSVHRDKLIEWSSRKTYLKYLNELEEKNIIKRGSAYQPGQFSKDLKINWKFRSSNQAVLREGRAIDQFEDALRTIHKPDEFRQLLLKAGCERTTSLEMINTIWKKNKDETQKI